MTLKQFKSYQSRCADIQSSPRLAKIFVEKTLLMFAFRGRLGIKDLQEIFEYVESLKTDE
jgi:hypothetical protein